MPDIYPPGYSYLYGPPDHRSGAANDSIVQASQAMQRASQTMQVASANIANSVSMMVGTSLTAAQRMVNPFSGFNQPMGQPTLQTYLPTYGFGGGVRTPSMVEALLNPNPTGFFARLTGIGLEQRGPGWLYGGTNSILEQTRYNNLQMTRGRMFGSGILRGAELAAGIAGFTPAAPVAMAVGAFAGNAADVLSGAQGFAQRVYNTSGMFLPPTVTGRARGGASVRESIMMGKELIKDWAKELDMSVDDIKSLHEIAARGGWYDKARSAKDMLFKQREFRKLAKEMAGTLDVAVDEAGGIVGELNKAGIEGSKKIRDVVYSATQMAQRMGVSTMDIMRAGMQAGAPMVQQGFAMGPSSTFGMQMFSGANMAYRTGNDATRSMIERYGGPSGVAQRMSDATANMAQSPIFQMLATRMFKIGAGGQLESQYTPGMGFKEIMGLKPGMGAADFFGMQHRMPSLIKDVAGTMRPLIAGMIKGAGSLGEANMRLVASGFARNAEEADLMIQTAGAASPSMSKEEKLSTYINNYKRVGEAERMERANSIWGIVKKSTSPLLRGITKDLTTKDFFWKTREQQAGSMFAQTEASGSLSMDLGGIGAPVQLSGAAADRASGMTAAELSKLGISFDSGNMVIKKGGAWSNIMAEDQWDRKRRAQGVVGAELSSRGGVGSGRAISRAVSEATRRELALSGTRSGSYAFIAGEGGKAFESAILGAMGLSGRSDETFARLSDDSNLQKKYYSKAKQVISGFEGAVTPEKMWEAAQKYGGEDPWGLLSAMKMYVGGQRGSTAKMLRESSSEGERKFYKGLGSDEKTRGDTLGYLAMFQGKHVQYDRKRGIAYAEANKEDMENPDLTKSIRSIGGKNVITYNLDRLIKTTKSKLEATEYGNIDIQVPLSDDEIKKKRIGLINKLELDKAKQTALDIRLSADNKTSEESSGKGKNEKETQAIFDRLSGAAKEQLSTMYVKNLIVNNNTPMAK